MLKVEGMRTILARVLEGIRDFLIDSLIVEVGVPTLP